MSVGEILFPANKLGFSYTYSAAAKVYDPGWVYLTSDIGSARAYAARYLTPEGIAVPGDVYEVRALDATAVDPDNAQFPEVFTRCRRAGIVRVVEQGVSLSRVEQVELEAPYYVWGSKSSPVFDSDGKIIPSQQMLNNGVTEDWTRLLRPWLSPHEVDPRGRLSEARRTSDPWSVFLLNLPSLGCGHQIARRTSRVRRRVSFSCQDCSFDTASERLALLHQLGEEEMSWLARIHGLKEGAVFKIGAAAARRDPVRWSWFSDERNL